MNVLVLRKKRFRQSRTSEEVTFDDISVRVVYVNRVNKRVNRLAREFDFAVSLDFMEFGAKSDLLRQLAVKAYNKIALRHGGVNRDILEVQVDILNEENAKVLIDLALNARYVVVQSDLPAEKFDFLCDEAGVCPEFTMVGLGQNPVVCLGKEFLIKHFSSGKTYFDVMPLFKKESDAYFLPELNMIFSEYLRRNPEKTKNVKIRELMSK